MLNRRLPGEAEIRASSDDEDQTQYPVSEYEMAKVRQSPEFLELTMSFNEKGLKSGGGWRCFGLQPLKGTYSCFKLAPPTGLLEV